MGHEMSTAEWHPSVNPWLIAGAVMLATFMEVLDTTIVSVALPNMAGGLASTNEEATWVLTSYLVANAVVLPASGWFSLRFGRKRFLLFCTALFTFASFLCAFAPTMPVLVLARILQGAGGGALQPLSQAILLESFPREKHGMAMAMFGLGVVGAPIIGPFLGGWLTDHYSWRWVFNINIPIGNKLAQATQARSLMEYRQAELRLEQLYTQIRMQVVNAQFALTNDRAQVQASTAARDYNQQSLDAENKKLKLGASTTANVLLQQRNLATAENNLISAHASYAKDRASLYQTLATTLHHYGINLNEAASGEVKSAPVVPGVQVAPPSKEPSTAPPASR